MVTSTTVDEPSNSGCDGSGADGGGYGQAAASNSGSVDDDLVTASIDIKANALAKCLGDKVLVENLVMRLGHLYDVDHPIKLLVCYMPIVTRALRYVRVEGGEHLLNLVQFCDYFSTKGEGC
uniref:Uncharacterized protein n=1 Tax=Oryza sativa subsp. japonica TaxID=39947 RepID=Q8H803_ORYSJ|nr:hypothetical protein [Oryza sativa Japonica Group]